MVQGAPAAFFSYCREDSDFALRLAGDLKAAGASVWLDQLDIVPGQRWDRAVDDALKGCSRLLVILSPVSVDSDNVMDEVSFALEEKKTVIPVVYKDCAVPFRLRRVQYVDFRQDYAHGLRELLKTLALEQKAIQGTPAISEVPSQPQTDVAEADKRERAAEEERRKGAEEQERAELARLDQQRKHAADQAQLEKERRKVEEEARQEQKRKVAAEQARLEGERNRAELALLEDERRKAAERSHIEEEVQRATEQARLEQERKQAEQARVEEKRRKADEQARREQERKTADERDQQVELERQSFAVEEQHPPEQRDIVTTESEPVLKQLKVDDERPPSEVRQRPAEDLDTVQDKVEQLNSRRHIPQKRLIKIAAAVCSVLVASSFVAWKLRPSPRNELGRPSENKETEKVKTSELVGSPSASEKSQLYEQRPKTQPVTSPRNSAKIMSPQFANCLDQRLCDLLGKSKEVVCESLCKPDASLLFLMDPKGICQTTGNRGASRMQDTNLNCPGTKVPGGILTALGIRQRISLLVAVVWYIPLRSLLRAMTKTCWFRDFVEE